MNGRNGQLRLAKTQSPKLTTLGASSFLSIPAGGVLGQGQADLGQGIKKAALDTADEQSAAADSVNASARKPPIYYKPVASPYGDPPLLGAILPPSSHLASRPFVVLTSFCHIGPAGVGASI